MPVITTQKDLLLETIPKMQYEIRMEMISFIKRKGYSEEIAINIIDHDASIEDESGISKQEKKRLKVLVNLRKQLSLISYHIENNDSLVNKLSDEQYDDETLGTVYRAELKTKIEAALLNPKITKQYGCFKKLAIRLLNFITCITIVPTLIKKARTGSFLYSTQVKSKEAVDRTQNLLNKLNEESAKITKKKKKPGK